MSPAWRRAAGARPLVLGHRGASAHEVENTMPAFARAAQGGADGVELDVRLTADGGLVVFHDDDLARLADGRPDRIERLSAVDVAAVRLVRDGRIPTLAEVLGELPGLLVNVEIKSRGAFAGGATARAVVAALRATGATERVVVSSFDPLAVAATRVLAPRVRTGLLFHRDQPAILREAQLARVLRPYAVHPEKILVNVDHLTRWRHDGYAVHVWTVDDRVEVDRLVRMGVDGIITNDPAATLGWLTRG